MKEIFKATSSGAYKLGAGACLVQILISWWIIISVLTMNRDAQWQFIWICLVPFDFPFSLLVFFAGYIFPDLDLAGLPAPWDDVYSFVLPVIVHGIRGPLWFFLLPVCVDGFMTRRSIAVHIKNRPT